MRSLAQAVAGNSELTHHRQLTGGMYACSFTEPTVSQCFVQLHKDNETQTFIDECLRRTTLCKSLTSSLLKLCFSSIDVNAWIDHGRMFVLSRSQVRQLLQLDDDEVLDGDLLDVGAGAGWVTKVLEDVVSGEIVATEVSKELIHVLERTHGFTAVQTARITQDLTLQYSRDGLGFSLVSCLNVLDRCDDPVGLIEDLVDAMAADGTLLLAVVLPFRGSVRNGRNWRVPEKDITTWFFSAHIGMQIQTLITRVLEPAGLITEAVSKVPYLSETDNYLSTYALLYDALFVCTKSDNV